MCYLYTTPLNARVIIHSFPDLSIAFFLIFRIVFLPEKVPGCICFTNFFFSSRGTLKKAIFSSIVCILSEDLSGLIKHKNSASDNVTDKLDTFGVQVGIGILPGMIIRRGNMSDTADRSGFDALS